MAMARFGLNPHGNPLYRLVFASSVKMLVGGVWPDGRAEYRAKPAYREIGDQWILERWLSAEQYTGFTAEEYALRFRDPMTGLYRNGPYPYDGAYFMCENGAIKPEALDSIEHIISGIEFSRRNQSKQRTIEREDAREKAQKLVAAAEESEALARIRECRPAFGARPTSFRSGVHTMKTKPLIKTANELGLPLGNNKLTVIRK